MLLDQQYARYAILTIFVRNSHVLSQVKTRFSGTILTKLEKFKFQMRSAKKKIPMKGMMFVFFLKKKNLDAILDPYLLGISFRKEKDSWAKR